MFWTDPWGLGMSMWRNAIALQETAVASHAVIGCRHDTIRAALSNPLDADVEELGRMVPEKVEAFTKAGTSLLDDCFAFQADWFAQMRDLGTIAIAGVPPSAAALDRIGRRAARITTRMSRAGGRALAPVHAAATANDRRLRKRAAKAR